MTAAERFETEAQCNLMEVESSQQGQRREQPQNRLDTRGEQPVDRGRRRRGNRRRGYPTRRRGSTKGSLDHHNMPWRGRQGSRRGCRTKPTAWWVPQRRGGAVAACGGFGKAGTRQRTAWVLRLSQGGCGEGGGRWWGGRRRGGGRWGDR